MALSKSISINNSGVTASYWRLVALSVDFLSSEAKITLAGYVDAQHRTDGFNPITVKTIRWIGSDNPITATQVMAGTAFTAAYTKLTEAQTNPLLPANPFEGASIV